MRIDMKEAAQLRKEYEAGASGYELGKKYYLSADQVYLRIRMAGGKIRSVPEAVKYIKRPIPDVWFEMADLHDQGHKVLAIALDYEMSLSGAYHRITKAKEWRRKNEECCKGV